MNIAEIKKFLEENKEQEEVQALIDSFKVEPTLEVFKEKIATDPEFKSFMDSEKDIHHSKALETWKANNLEALIDNKVKELYPEQDPKDVELQKLKQEMEDIKNAATRERMTNLALKKASEKGIPADLVDFLVSNDETKTLENIERFSTSYTEGIQTTLKQKLEGQGDFVPKDKNFNGISPEDFEGMTITEKTKLYEENKDLYNELAK